MKRCIWLMCCAAASMAAQANDSIGFVGTGGIQYLKSPDIAMEREDLYISKKQIRVEYRFKNLRNHDVSETILFPLPMLDRQYHSDFADTEGLIDSFKVWVNGQAVKPQAHVRAFLYPRRADGSEAGKPQDATAALKRCGFSDSELMNPWTNRYDNARLYQRFSRCQEAAVLRFRKQYPLSADDAELLSPWAAQIVYSWPQTFKAGAITEVKHEYQPLVGSATYFDARKSKHNSLYTEYCIDDAFRRQMQKDGKKYVGHQTLEYILTTGANWAKPIGTFTLTLERDEDELMSLCWNHGLKKIASNRFYTVKHNFIPDQDLNILFALGVDE